MPRIDYSLLVIDNLIIHDVPKHKKGSARNLEHFFVEQF